MFCPKCGKENNNDAKFCQECGFKIEDIQIAIITGNQESAVNSTKPITEKITPSVEKHSDEKISQIRPWVRFWARSIDIILIANLLYIVFEYVSPAPSIKNVRFYILDIIIFSMLSLFIWAFIEALLLSTWGTTPGKWFFKIHLRHSLRYKPSYSYALNRSLSVWWRGLGIGFPLIQLITQFVAYIKLKRHGSTTWDRKYNFTVSHEKIGALRIIVFILILILYGFLFHLGRN